MGYWSYINGFRMFLQLEKGLSENTIDAYLHDTQLFFSYLDQADDKKTIPDLALDDLRAFLSYINRMNLSPNSQSRVVSGLKSFFRFLILEGVIKKDPTELLESPK